MKILKKDTEGIWVAIEDKPYLSEDELQDLLAQDLSMIPFAEIGYDEPFVAIGREATVSVGSMDVLAVSPSGQIAIIEAKLGRNGEVKRKVVGQVLSYAAHLWKMPYTSLEEAFAALKNKYSIDNKLSLYEYVCMKAGTEPTNVEDFREGLTKRLELGSFTLIVVVDERNEELADIASYLNDRTGQEIDFYVVEIKQIGDETNSYIIPELINPPRKTIESSTTLNHRDKYDRRPMSYETFQNIASSEARRIAAVLLDNFVQDEDYEIAWRKNGFSIRTRTVLPTMSKELGYDSRYSYLYLNAGKEGNSQIEMGYPDAHFYDSNSHLYSIVQPYGRFYSSMPSYKRSGWLSSITDLRDIDETNLKNLVTLIRQTNNAIKNLAENQQ